MYRTYNARPLPQPTKPRRRRWPLALFLVVMIAAFSGYIVFALLRPIPAIKTTITPPVLPALVKVNVPWPASSPKEQSAYGAVGYGLLATSSDSQIPQPTASVAKVITALAILNKKPLAAGETGPAISLGDNDVNLYNQYVAEDGSVVPVSSGETISEYEGLQAMMLPSANNIADSMAIWAFGTLDAYNSFANSFVKTLGMTNTTVTSASGFLPTTVSTAADLVKLGTASLANPALTTIVAQRTADTPDFGMLSNVNTLVGQYGITGLKTGNTDQAGGCFLATANVPIDGTTITIITAVMEAPSLPQALRDSLPLVQSAPSLFQAEHVVWAGQAVGQATTPWGDNSSITATQDISVITWSGTAVAPTVRLSHLPLPAAAGKVAGSLSLQSNGTNQSTGLALAQAIGKPDLLWRLEHAF